MHYTDIIPIFRTLLDRGELSEIFSAREFLQAALKNHDTERIIKEAYADTTIGRQSAYHKLNSVIGHALASNASVLHLERAGRRPSTNPGGRTSTTQVWRIIGFKR